MIAPVLFPVGELDLRGAFVKGFEQRSHRGRTGNLDYLPFHGDHFGSVTDLLGEILFQLEIEDQTGDDHPGRHFHNLSVEFVVVRHRIDKTRQDQIRPELLTSLPTVK